MVIDMASSLNPGSARLLYRIKSAADVREEVDRFLYIKYGAGKPRVQYVILPIGDNLSYMLVSGTRRVRRYKPDVQGRKMLEKPFSRIEGWRAVRKGEGV
jgi:hypothetical protein